MAGNLGGPIDTSIWNAVKAAFPDATLNSAYRPGDSGFHGKASACDIGGPMQEVANWAVRQDLAQVIYGPGPLLYNVGGTHITDQAQLRNQVYAGDLPGHYDHVHLAAEHPITGGATTPADSAANTILGGSGNPISNATEIVKASAAVVKNLTNREFWIRILKGVGGTFLVLMALYYLMQDEIVGTAMRFLGGDAGEARQTIGKALPETVK